MIFKCFSESDREIDWLNSKVNEYIEEHEKKGYRVVKQETLIQTHNPNGTIPIIVSLWMDK
ncbi:hypothetical protein DOJK_01653 [Patescibacteria group bacterium]|nr:hypothetical protein DOJK_01653 [Patescibacteria group bacterium]